jgi:hypothetical protein
MTDTTVESGLSRVASHGMRATVRGARGALLASSVTLAGCATFAPTVPDGWAGPTVALQDSATADEPTRGTFFFVSAIDGKSVDNAAAASRRGSAGHGFSLTVHFVSRAVPVRPMRLRLVGTHQTAAPVHEMAARMVGNFQQVRGEVDFNPVPEGNYRVTGVLDPKQSCVWVEETNTQAVVTEKVCTSDAGG